MYKTTNFESMKLIKRSAFCFLTISFVVLQFNACKTDKKTNSNSFANDVHTLSIVMQQCVSCHKAETNANLVSGPSLGQIRAGYLTHYQDSTSFVDAIQSFLKNPSKENVMLHKSYTKYGLMPKIEFDSADISHIAAYLYAHDIESQAWQQSWAQVKDTLRVPKKILTPLAQGAEYANATKMVLGKNLVAAVQAKGVENALEFCNIQALPLTDSMASQFGVSIKRVSDKPRNPRNQATAVELKIIERFKTNILNKTDDKGYLVSNENTNIGYYSIITNEMCLKCHGAPGKDVQAATLKKLATYYPKDQAVGYASDELRGMWVVEMPRNNVK